ncbi:shikimate dehydrogenase [Gilvimarinus sp. SDUM040013]|uniref:Shikimate dehydrogenase (NADP(+)) n=1 Tax=Gilvimarinus gilvus TaxID=3058038 RepID=A0ABU4RVD4_9GAMM|nr:shikimate dehydrogenase [Gilvimarinus sp. SDUM040013]MDO3387725.1 shikimate dehydrogenase [Gilvimarinus sp. SDUM040013]MDX6848834.1 shikimate dehydrogenase [Gilvimarinus sp. SDUM040013]
MTDNYAVFGNPIAQSKSPVIHRQFCDQTGEDMSYTKQLVAEGEFKQAADEFFRAGGRGLNITAPFKLDAYAYANALTPRAKRAKAVNLLIKEADGSVTGDNSDGIGMVNDMLNLGWDIQDKHVLLLGAGGAVRGVLQPLLNQNPAQVTIANRTVEKAEELAQDFHDLGSIDGCGFEALAGKKYDLIINGTSAGLHGSLPTLPDQLCRSGAACYDMTYAAEPTLFMQWAEQQGADKLSDGLGMLVGQAAESFYAWRHIRPEVVPVITDLRRKMKESKKKAS